MDTRNPHTERLDAIGEDDWYERGANAAMIEYCASIFARHFVGSTCLELGPAQGLLTRSLVDRFDHVTVVEGSRRFCDRLAREHPSITVCHALFEDFTTADRYDTIVLGHVLEHVEDPRAVLRRVRAWLAVGGVVLAAVPNARSLHRELAVELGMLQTIYELNATDIHHGHHRVYDPDQLRHDFESAGFEIELQGGYWLKTLSNAQIEATYSDELLRACMVVGERYPEIAAETYVVAR